MPFWGKKEPAVAPVAKNVLLEKLLALNNPSNPFGIRRSDETDLYIEHIVNAESKFATAGEFKRGFKAWLLLDEGSHEARFCAETTMEQERNWIAPTFGGTRQKMVWRGGTVHHRGATYVGGKKVSEYDFDMDKTLKKIVEENGWKFKTVFTKGSATYKK
jgi:hypothetical protein